MIKKLFPYIGQYKRYLILAPIVVVLETLSELTLPRIMATIVDDGIPTGDLAYIVKYGLIMFVMALLAMLLGTMASKFTATATQGFGANLRQALYNKVQEFSFADIDLFSTGSLITRMTNDVTAITTMMVMGMRMLVRAPVMLTSAMIIAFTINAKLAMILVIVIPIVGAIIGSIMYICSKLFTIMQQRIDDLNSSVQESLVAVRVVKAFVREGYERTKFMRSNDELTAAALKVGARTVVMMPVMTLALNIATVAVLWVGGRQVMGDQLLVGELSAFLIYISQILNSVIMLGMTLLQVSRAQACAQRTCEVLDAQASVTNSEESATATLPQSSGQVEFRNVTFKYVASATGDDVLSHIDLKIDSGAFFAIVGGTGVGKSALVNLIPRFSDVTGGQVLVDGMDVRDYPLEDLRSRIGMVLQNNVLFSGTIRENLLWGKTDATEEELIRATKDAQAYDFIMALPQGFDTWLEQGGVNVSGGQKQRLCIARAMLRQPAILILDDSTSAVDSSTEAAIRTSFSQNLASTTVIIIAQRISSVQYADKIAVIEDDHIAGIGTHQELMEGNAIYQEIYQSQQEGVQE